VVGEMRPQHARHWGESHAQQHRKPHHCYIYCQSYFQFVFYGNRFAQWRHMNPKHDVAVCTKFWLRIMCWLKTLKYRIIREDHTSSSMQEYETQSINWNFHYYECEQQYSVQYQVLRATAVVPLHADGVCDRASLSRLEFCLGYC
jgi:hypothetical protein